MCRRMPAGPVADQSVAARPTRPVSAPSLPKRPAARSAASPPRLPRRLRRPGAAAGRHSLNSAGLSGAGINRAMVRWVLTRCQAAGVGLRERVASRTLRSPRLGCSAPPSPAPSHAGADLPHRQPGSPSLAAKTASAKCRSTSCRRPTARPTRGPGPPTLDLVQGVAPKLLSEFACGHLAPSLPKTPSKASTNLGATQAKA